MIPDFLRNGFHLGRETSLIQLLKLLKPGDYLSKVKIVF